MSEDRPDREGKKVIQAFVPLDEWRTLRNVATKTARNQTDLLREAIAILADKYGVNQGQPARNGHTSARSPNSARQLRHH
jgi:hypothetical protein